MLDLLLMNGRIYTMAQEDEYVQALGVKDGKVAFAGTVEQAGKLPAARVLDLQGKTVIPGMGDSHMHFYAYCQTLTQTDLGNCASKAEMLQKLREAVDAAPKGQWLRGANFDQTKWTDSEDALPTRHDLDQVSEEHPIVIKRVCLHTAVANTKALELAGIGRDYVDGPGGIVEREADGTPNGVLREQLTRVFDELIPNPMEEDAVKYRLMSQELRHMASLGMTCMHTYAAEIWRYIEDVKVYEKLERMGALPLRVAVYSDRLEELIAQMPERGPKGEDPYQLIQLGGYKLFCDGSLGSRSAALYEPYSDDPGNVGIVVEDAASLEEKMVCASKHNILCAVHAIGDRALDMVLTAIEGTIGRLEREGRSRQEFAERPFRVIHAQMATRELIERMKALPLILDIQPAFLQSDRHWVLERIGARRFQTAYPWETYQKKGLRMTGGSDSPVESFDPLIGIYNCLTHPNPAERLSIYDAVSLFTRNLPYATGDERRLGTLEVGKFADMAVLDRDIFHTPVEEIPGIKVERTLLAGRETWIAGEKG